MKNIAEYIYTKSGNQRELLSTLNEVIIGYPQIRSSIRYGVPFYGKNKWICYLNSQKSGAIEVCFLQGSKLNVLHPQVDMKKRKQVGGLLIAEFDDQTINQLDEVMKSAIDLDTYQMRKSK